MSKKLETVLENHPHPTIRDVDIAAILEGSPDSRYGVVKRAIKNGWLVRIRRGLYQIKRGIWKNHLINNYQLAQEIYGPSFISFESALSYHGWIPEAVYTVTSATVIRSKEFSTPLGQFAYLKVPEEGFLVGVSRVKNESGTFYMATPSRAILDYVHCNKKQWDSIQPLIKSLRIEPEQIHQTSILELDQLAKVYHGSNEKQFIDGIKEDLSKWTI